MLGQCLGNPSGSPVPAFTSCTLLKLNRRLLRYKYRNNPYSFIWINCSWLGIHLSGCMYSQTGFIFQIPDLVPKETTRKRCHLRTVPVTAGSAIKASQQQLIRFQVKFSYKSLNNCPHWICSTTYFKSNWEGTNIWTIFLLIISCNVLFEKQLQIKSKLIGQHWFL